MPTAFFDKKHLQGKLHLDKYVCTVSQKSAAPESNSISPLLLIIQQLNGKLKIVRLIVYQMLKFNNDAK